MCFLLFKTLKKFTFQVVHNYGHGGCGVTMHWGCAKKAVRLVSEFVDELKLSSKL